MAREREIKVRLKGIKLEEFIFRIEKMGFKLQKTIEQLDIYFDRTDWYLYDHLAALRLRKVDGRDYSVSFKKMFYLPNKPDKHYIEEIETRFPVEHDKFNQISEIFGMKGEADTSSGETITNYFRRNGYFDEQKMPKIRKIFQMNDDEIVVDDVDKVGVIIEIECQTGEPMEIAKKLLKDDEWHRDVEGTSYIWLKNVIGLDRHLKHLKRFESEPDWNVWENEKEYYGNISK